jgi:NTE family protein
LSSTRKLGLALGGGAARGWAHIGVLRALETLDIPVAAIAGTSMGALIGAFAANRQVEQIELFALGLAARNVGHRLLDLTLPRSGLVEGRKITRLIEDNLGVRRFDQLRLPFRAVATDLLTGAEVILAAGDIVEAVRASIAIPGIFTPVAREGALLADGGLVNPVPVSVARALGVEAVIAVDLNCFAGPAAHGRLLPAALQQRLEQSAAAHWAPVRRWLGAAAQPNIFDVMGHSFRIIEQQIAAVRLRVEPADVLIRPDVGAVGIMDFHRAAPAIEAGYLATMAQRDALRALVTAG